MRIALDIDDVLAGYSKGVHEVFSKTIEPHNHWSPDESTGLLILKKNESGKVVGYTQDYLDKCEHNQDFWYYLEPISLPIDLPKSTVCYITSSPKNMVEIRIKWLEKHGFPKLPVIHSKDKSKTMIDLGVDILVDDNLETVKKVREKSILNAYHFTPWYSTLREDKSITHLKWINQ